MTDERKHPGPGDIDLDEVEELDIDLDSTEQADVEGALREALEAVERGGEERGSGQQDIGGSDELAALRAEVAELRDRSVRTLADFDNYRKRSERERDEQRRYAGAEILREVLNVVDNLERALEAGGELDDLRTGVELIGKQMLDLLRRYGVERVEAVGRAFDPTVHDAVSKQETDDVSGPTVVDELQPGYLMKDRLLRPATVVVAVPPAEQNEE